MLLNAAECSLAQTAADLTIYMYWFFSFYLLHFLKQTPPTVANLKNLVTVAETVRNLFQSKMSVLTLLMVNISLF